VTRQLTTTSYAILGLLGFRSWTAYELAGQMERSLSFIWPRAVSAIYEEPKILVAHGLANARQERNGRQRRTRYSITPKGRRALRAWLGEPSAPPQFSSEAALRMMFADQGDSDDILATVAELEAHAHALNERLLAMARSYADGSGPFPDRAHINAAVGRLCHEYATALARWAEWAREEIAAWPSTGQDAAQRAPAILADNLRRFGRRPRRRPPNGQVPAADGLS